VASSAWQESGLPPRCTQGRALVYQVSERAASGAPAESTMDPFRATHWNQLQAVLWVCSRSRVVLRLAADQTLPRDADEDAPGFDDDVDLIGAVILPGGCVWRRRRHDRLHCAFDESIERILHALQSGHIRAFARRNGSGERVQIPQQE
jgi:hypothetical protein